MSFYVGEYEDEAAVKKLVQLSVKNNKSSQTIYSSDISFNPLCLCLPQLIFSHETSDLLFLCETTKPPQSLKINLKDDLSVCSPPQCIRL